MILSFILFTVAPIAILYGLLYDPSTKRTDIDESFAVEKMATRIIVDSLDNTTTRNDIEIAITEKDLDNILDYALNQAGVKNQYVKKAYCVIKGTSYKFYVDLDGVVIQSRLKISTTLTESEDKKTFIFEVNDLGIGNINGFASIAKTALNSYIPEGMVDDVFKSAGLSMKFDKKNLKLTYDKADLLVDIGNFMQGGEADLFMTVIKTLMEKDLAAFNLESNNFLEVNIDLKPLATNEFVTDDSAHRRIKPEEVSTNCRDKLVTLLNNHTLDPETDDLNTVFSFLFKGYGPLSDQEKAIIDPINFSSVGIVNNSTYVPVYESGVDFMTSEEYLFEKMQDRLMNAKSLLSDSKEVTLLYEDDINTYIASRDISGFKVILNRKMDEGYKVNYVLMDNFYSNIYKNSEGQVAELVCKLNINGYHTSLTFETEATIENNESLTFTVKDNGIRYGSIAAKELNDQFFDIVSGAMNGGDSTISADPEKHAFTLSFAGLISQAKESLYESLYRAAQLNVNPLIFGYISIQLENAIRASLDDTFDTTNAEIVINGENRAADGTLKLLLKNNDFKTIFKEKMLIEIDPLPDYIKAMIDIDAILDQLVA